jgi:hypothetical protein
MKEHILSVSESKVLRRIFGPKKRRRKLRNDKLYHFCSSSNILTMLKSRIRWAGCIAYMGKMFGQENIR